MGPEAKKTHGSNPSCFQQRRDGSRRMMNILVVTLSIMTATPAITPVSEADLPSRIQALQDQQIPVAQLLPRSQDSVG